MRIALLIVLILVGWFLWKNMTIPSTTGLIDGKLQPCPQSPNCVSCQNTDPRHAIAPLPLVPGKSLDFIAQFLEENYLAEVVTKTSVYMHVVVTTDLCRFKDDLEFFVDDEKKEICVRSASRVGYGDGGINRARIEKLREAL
ncbi:MAG: DUF1499 domain-containing protein [Chlamydiota bacterium]